jgi:hypothetical protein
MTQSMRGGGSGRGHGKGQYGSSHNHHLHHSALCCLSAAPPLPGDATPTLTPEPEAADAAVAAAGPAVVVEGVLHKWTNYGRGWRERWFSLRDGVLSYSKIRADAGGVARAGAQAGAAADGDGEVRLIGSRMGGARRTEKPAGVVFLKVRSLSSLSLPPPPVRLARDPGRPDLPPVGQIPFRDFVLSFACRRFLPAFLTAPSVNAIRD